MRVRIFHRRLCTIIAWCGVVCSSCIFVSLLCIIIGSIYFGCYDYLFGRLLGRLEAAARDLFLFLLLFFLLLFLLENLRRIHHHHLVVRFDAAWRRYLRFVWSVSPPAVDLRLCSAVGFLRVLSNRREYVWIPEEDRAACGDLFADGREVDRMVVALRRIGTEEHRGRASYLFLVDCRTLLASSDDLLASRLVE